MKRLKKVLRRIRLIKNWYQFMFPFDRIGSWPRVAKLRSGAKIEVEAFRSTDFAILNEILIDDVYGIDRYKNPKKIIDIGANTGIYSMIVSKKFPECKVIAFEPEHNNFQRLKKNSNLSNAENVTLINKAIADKEGTATLQLGENCGMHSLQAKSGHDTQTVETTTISKYFPTDILKVDAEGAEYDVFSKEIPDCKIIAMEIHQFGDQKDLLKRLGEKYFIESNGPTHILTHK